MSHLEAKGFLYHPHTSAGRIPTDRRLSSLRRPDGARDAARLASFGSIWSSSSARPTPTEELLPRAAQVLGIVTQELGVAVGPALDEIVLERVDLVAVSSERAPAGLESPERDRPNDLRASSGYLVARAIGRGAAAPERAARRTCPFGEFGRRSANACAMRRRRPEATELLDIILAEGDGLFDLQGTDVRAGELLRVGGAARVRVE